jgi:hypothetical protein
MLTTAIMLLNSNMAMLFSEYPRDPAEKGGKFPTCQLPSTTVPAFSVVSMGRIVQHLRKCNVIAWKTVF